MKKFEFVSQAAMKAYLALPKDIQYQFGTDLNAVQQGKDPFSAQEEGGYWAQARQGIDRRAREMS